MECLRTDLPRERVPHPERSVKMEKVNRALKSSHYVLPSPALYPPQGQSLGSWFHLTIPGSETEGQALNHVAVVTESLVCWWNFQRGTLVPLLSLTSFPSSSLGHTCTPTHPHAFSNFKYRVICNWRNFKKITPNLVDQQSTDSLCSLYLAVVTHLTMDLYVELTIGIQRPSHLQITNHSLTTWSMPSCQP
jgi:hypothetical protein